MQRWSQDQRRRADRDRRGEDEGTLVVGQRRGQPRQRRADADAGVEEGRVGPHHRPAGAFGDAADGDQHQRGVEQGEGGAHRHPARQGDREAVGEGDRQQPGCLDQRRADRHAGGAVEVGEVAGEEPGEHDHRREGAEDEGAVADPASFEVEDDEGGERRVADRGEGDREAGANRLGGDQRVRLAVGEGLEMFRDASRDRRPQQRHRRGEDPDRPVAARFEQQVAGQRADAEPAPDRQPVEAEHPAAAGQRRQVDDPG